MKAKRKPRVWRGWVWQHRNGEVEGAGPGWPPLVCGTRKDARPWSTADGHAVRVEIREVLK